MGSSSSKHSSRLNEQQWKVIVSDSSALFTNVNSYPTRALRNIRSNEQIQQYNLQFSSQKQYLQYLTQLRPRRQPSSVDIEGESQPSDSYAAKTAHIYNVRYFINDTMQDMCSTIYKGLLYVQKVDLRLKQINDIPFNDLLYLTRACLQGFKVLYQKFGSFDICQQMVFIDRRGRVKVWLNPNLSKNQPYIIPNNTLKQLHCSQSQMINNLLTLIQQNMDNQHDGHLLQFKQYLQNKNIYDRLSYYKALEQFELFCQEEKYQVPIKMNSIYQLYHPQEDQVSQVDQTYQAREVGRERRELLEREERSSSRRMSEAEHEQMHMQQQQQQQYMQMQRQLQPQQQQQYIQQYIQPQQQEQYIQQQQQQQRLSSSHASTRDKTQQPFNGRGLEHHNSRPVHQSAQRRPIPQMQHLPPLPPATFRAHTPQFGNSQALMSQAQRQPHTHTQQQGLFSSFGQSGHNGPTVSRGSQGSGSGVVRGNVIANQIKDNSGYKAGNVRFNYQPQSGTQNNAHNRGMQLQQVQQAPQIHSTQPPAQIHFGNHQQRVLNQAQPQSQPQLPHSTGGIQPTSPPTQPPLHFQPSKPYAIGSNLVTMKTINSQSLQNNNSSRQRDFSFHPNSSPFGRPQAPISQNMSKVSYYSAYEQFNLDNQIAQDLQTFLGYNPKQ